MIAKRLPVSRDLDGRKAPVCESDFRRQVGEMERRHGWESLLAIDYTVGWRLDVGKPLWVGEPLSRVRVAVWKSCRGGQIDICTKTFVVPSAVTVQQEQAGEAETGLAT